MDLVNLLMIFNIGDIVRIYYPFIFKREIVGEIIDINGFFYKIKSGDKTFLFLSSGGRVSNTTKKERFLYMTHKIGAMDE